MKVVLKGNRESKLNVGPRKTKFTGRLKTKLRGGNVVTTPTDEEGIFDFTFDFTFE